MILTALAPWNAWDEPSLFTGIRRGITDEIMSFIGRPEVLVLTGMRRCGKSTIMYQLIETLVARGIKRQEILFVNFDEPALNASRGTELLEDIYIAFRTKMSPTGHVYLFLDEIQNVPGWEKWVNARLKTEDVDIIVSGSSAQLMSREIATLLTGRNITFRIFSLSFGEFLHFRNVEIDLSSPLSWEKKRHQISNELDNYLLWGALPEAVLAADDLHRRKLLNQYLDDILFKDVVIRHQIRDARLLRDMAIFLLTHTACRITLQALRKTFAISLDMARSYLSYLEEPYLINEVRGYARSLKAQQVSARKIYAGDLGMRQVASLTKSEVMSRLEETAVFHKLEQKGQQLFYWNERNKEIDFLVCNGLEPSELIQVTHSDLSNPQTEKRELAPLLEPAIFQDAAKTLITSDWPDHAVPEPVQNYRLWEWLLVS